jgi:hypothetical protein
MEKTRINWLGLIGEMLMLASAFVILAGAIFLAGQLGYHSTQGEWLP